MPLLANANAILDANGALLDQYDLLSRRQRQLASAGLLLRSGRTDDFGLERRIIGIVSMLRGDIDLLRRDISTAATPLLGLADS